MSNLDDTLTMIIVVCMVLIGFGMGWFAGNLHGYARRQLEENKTNNHK